MALVLDDKLIFAVQGTFWYRLPYALLNQPLVGSELTCRCIHSALYLTNLIVDVLRVIPYPEVQTFGIPINLVRNRLPFVFIQRINYINLENYIKELTILN